MASKTPAQIVALAKSAALGAASVHVAGSIVSAGEPISIDMELLADMGGMGRISLGSFSFRLIEVDGSVFVKGARAFYDAFVGAASARMLQGKWLKASAKSGPLSELANLADLGWLLRTALAGHGSLARGGNTTIDGQRAVGVRDAAAGGTLYVAATGTPYPLEIVESGAGRGRIAFDGWDQPVSLSVPVNVINIKQLERVR